MEHGPCVEWGCPYFDPEAAEALDQDYREYVAREQERMLALLADCPRCSRLADQVGAEFVEEIVFHVMSVLQDRAVHRWFHKWISSLQSTPVRAIENGRLAEVLALTRGYEDPGFG